MAAEHPESEFQDLPTKSVARGFLPILWQRKALVLLGLVLGLAGGFLFYLQREPVYQSTALVLVIKKHMQPLPTTNDTHLHYFEDYMATHVVVLRAPLIIDRAVKKKDLATLKTFENSADPVGQILGSLSVTRDIKEGANNIVYLSFRGPVPEDCGKVLTAIIESYQEYLDKQYRNVSDETHELITKARDILKNDWAESEKNKARFDTQTPIYWNPKQGASVILERISDVEKKRSLLIVHLDELRVRITYLAKAIQDGKGSESLVALSRAVDAKGLTPEKAAEKGLADQLLVFKLEEQKLLETYGEDHPQVQSVRSKMALIQEHHNTTGAIEPTADTDKDPVSRLLAIMREELRDTDMRLKALDNLLDGLNKQAKELRSYETQEESLRNEVVRAKELYDGTVKRLKEISVGRDSGGFNTSVLAQSGIGVKVAPSAFQTIMGGAMLGLLLGIGLAFLADLTDKGFRGPDEVRVHLQLPLLGHVPFLKPDPEIEKKIKAGELAIDPLLYAQFRPKSLEAEAYRAIRTALLFTVQGQGHRVLQVTSPSKGDGKSLMVANLAISIAQSEKKILIIDADCRRPRQHKIFNLPNNQGLVNVIRQDAPWQSCVQKTPVDGLWILPSGPIPQNPAELLTSPMLKQLLQEVRQEFDLVLVDSPPLLAVTDPCIVSGKVDGVILVLRLSRQGKPNAERACQIMKSLKVNVLGLVVNGVTRQGGGIYSSEQYDYTDAYENEQTGGEDDYYYHEEDAPTTGDSDRGAGQNVRLRILGSLLLTQAMNMIPLVDIHCHLLAGLDDGPRTMEAAVEMCALAFQEGVRLMAAGAHQNERWADVTPAAIHEATRQLEAALQRQGIAMTVFPCAEVMAHPNTVEHWHAGKLLSVNDGGKYLLLEMPHGVFVDLVPTVRALRECGLRAILAHPEREPRFLHEPGEIEAMIEAGCLVQVSASNVTGPKTAADEKALKEWFRRGIVHLLGSDGHSPQRRPPKMARAHQRVADWVGPAQADRIASGNGLAVVHGLPLHIPRPLPRQRRWWRQLVG